LLGCRGTNIPHGIPLLLQGAAIILLDTTILLSGDAAQSGIRMEEASHGREIVGWEFGRFENSKVSIIVEYGHMVSIKVLLYVIDPLEYPCIVSPMLLLV
jgi:hypothetical protein